MHACIPSHRLKTGMPLDFCENNWKCMCACRLTENEHKKRQSSERERWNRRTDRAKNNGKNGKSASLLKDYDIHVLDGWMLATKTHPACTIHEDGMWLLQWLDLKNGHIHKNLTQNGEPQRYSWGMQKKKKEKKKECTRRKRNSHRPLTWFNRKAAALPRHHSSVGSEGTEHSCQVQAVCRRWCFCWCAAWLCRKGRLCHECVFCMCVCSVCVCMCVCIRKYAYTHTYRFVCHCACMSIFCACKSFKREMIAGMGRIVAEREREIVITPSPGLILWLQRRGDTTAV